MDTALFIIFALIATVCGINIVVQTHPISSALSLIGVMGSLAVLFLLLGAEFLAAVQMLVYAGAIMVLFIFVIMLLNAGAERVTRTRQLVKILGIPLMAVFLGIVAFVIQGILPRGQMVWFGAFKGGGPRDIGIPLFTEYLLPFEITSVLVLIAILGAIVLARKEID